MMVYVLINQSLFNHSRWYNHVLDAYSNQWSHSFKVGVFVSGKALLQDTTHYAAVVTDALRYNNWPIPTKYPHILNYQLLVITPMSTGFRTCQLWLRFIFCCSNFNRTFLLVGSFRTPVRVENPPNYQFFFEVLHSGSTYLIFDLHIEGSIQDKFIHTYLLKLTESTFRRSSIRLIFLKFGKAIYDAVNNYQHTIVRAIRPPCDKDGLNQV